MKETKIGDLKIKPPDHDGDFEIEFCTGFFVYLSEKQALKLVKFITDNLEE